MNQKATILIVSGNIDSKNARDCLNSLKANTSLQLIREVIVIEAGIRPDFNHSEEINRILPIFKGDYLVLLDDDVVLKAGWLDGLIGCAQNCKDAGIVGAVLTNSKGKIIHTGGDVTDAYFGIELKEPISKPTERKYVCSAVMLITHEAAKKIGPFDEGYRKYGQETDYCLRAWEAGFKVVASPEAVAVHLVGKTVKLRPDMKDLWEKDRARFYSKWKTSPFYNKFYVIDLGRRGFAFPAMLGSIKKCKHKAKNMNPNSLDEIKRELDELRNKYHIEYIDISETELTDYGHLRELVSYCSSIGLLSTIITNGQNSEVIADLIDDGIEDLLINVPGCREDLSQMPGSQNTFEDIRKTIGIAKQKKFGFRTTTKVSGFNYKHLPKLSEELIDLQPRMADFVFFYPNRDNHLSEKNIINLQPKYSEVALYLKDSINLLQATGIWVNVRYFPLCLLKGYEQNICNFHQAQWDPYQWDYFQIYSLDNKGRKKIRRRAERENLHGHHREEYTKLWITKHWFCAKNLFFKQCRQCINKYICDGISPQYAARFGSAEFEPLKGEPLRDPLHYRRKNLAWRIMKPKPESSSNT